MILSKNREDGFGLVLILAVMFGVSFIKKPSVKEE